VNKNLIEGENGEVCPSLIGEEANIREKAREVLSAGVLV